MPWKRRSKMSKKIRTEAVEHLFEAVLCLQNSEECYSFFEDICTVNELLSLSQRYEVARMLRNHNTYLEIEEKIVKLIRKSNARGGTDNISIAYLCLEGGEEQ